MLKKTALLYLIVGSTLLTTASFAGESKTETSLKDVSVISKVGTLGLGIEFVSSINQKIDWRLGLNSLSQSRSDTYSDVDYKLDVDLQTISALADWRPYGGSFYLTGGAVLNNNEISAQGTQTGTSTVGDKTFTGEATFDTTIKFDDLSPYLGLGYRKKTSVKGFSFTADAGVLFQEDPEVTLTVDVPSGSNVTQADVDEERRQIQDDVSALDYWPVVSIGVMYKF